MDWFSAAERLAAIDRSSVTFQAERCLHSQDQFSSCAACFDLCPVQAIRPGKPPALDTKGCLNCLACLPACPQGAFSADDALTSLLTCAARLESRRFELACQLHPDAGLGWTEAEVGIQVRGCLAGLGVAAYLSLAALNFEHVIVRTDACEECPLSQLYDRIRSQITQAQSLLALYGKVDFVAWVDPSTPDAQFERPLWHADNPPLSRRALFSLASRQGQIAIGRALAGKQASTWHGLPRERRRLLGAMAYLEPVQDPAAHLEGMGFASLSTSQDCTACGVCARACPTGALRFEDEDTSFRLSLSPQACTACEVCLHVCAPDAIRLNEAPTFAQIFGRDEAVVLVEGEFTKCFRCGARFASRPGQRYCPVCEFRRQNPFGSAAPPVLKNRAGRSS